MEKVKNTKELPDSINVVNHVSGRIRELRKIYNDVATKKSEMLIHQMLPNFMRRRAMSHNPKRLPAKYRQIHKSQMAKSGLEDQTKKRPSRKYRRKPNNLFKEYARRTKSNIWLETHIWHAKRFKMKKMWGYKVPFTPNDKRYKASYRAAVKHCLLQDISFYRCIEVSGPFEVLKEGFSRIINNDEMPTITAKCFVNGTREGKCTVFMVK
jgi:ribonuclease P/MRP protein subunit POP1